MAEWTDWPTAAFADDRTVHAGVTRAYIHDNLEVAYEESGFDLDTWTSNDPNGGISYLLHDSILTYEIFAEWVPLPIPVSPARGGGWRQLGLDVEVEMENGATKAYFRFFLHTTPATPAISATTGEAEGAEGATITTTSLVWERQQAVIDIPQDVAVIRCDDGVLSPMVWLHLSSKVDNATHEARVRSVHLYEVP